MDADHPDNLVSFADPDLHLCPTHRETPKPKWYGEPYPGLDYFDHTQAPIFFGRETETQQLIERLQTQQGQRLLIVTGASGSGKSSLVRAGLWARLEQGRCPEIPGSREWLITAMMPTEWGDDPLCSLVSSLKKEAPPDLNWLRPGPEHQRLKANPETFPELIERVLAHRPPATEWLLILDQMEELFTPAVGNEGDAFLDFLLEAVKRPRFRVVATVRLDSLDRCVAHPGLCGVLNRQGPVQRGRAGSLGLGAHGRYRPGHGRRIVGTARRPAKNVALT